MVDSTLLEVLAIAISLHYLKEMFNGGMRRPFYQSSIYEGLLDEKTRRRRDLSWQTTSEEEGNLVVA